MHPFNQKAGRDVAVLAGPWRFQLDQDDLGIGEEWFSDDFDRSGWAEVEVPRAWDFYEHALWGYEGIGWYTTEIPAEMIRSGTWQRLFFTRVSVYAQVWLNGQYLGEHVGAYLPFEFAATPSLHSNKGNVLVVRVDNAPRLEWLPGGKVIEWVQYGGILQPVLLLTTAAAYISDFSIVAVPDGSGARVTCEVEVTNASPTELRSQVTVRIPSDGSLVADSEDIVCEPQGTVTASIALNVPAADKWSPESPVLYEASATLAKDEAIQDEIVDTFGVRSIEVRGREILLNGEPLYIKGVNRYDEYAGFGPTVPEDVVREDLLRIKQAGANFIRVHYPHDTTTLKLMDEIGLLLMEEIPLNWWKADPADDNEAIINAAEKVLGDMVRRDKNHPCLIIWSMANECATDTATGIEAMRRLMRRARALDPTRLVTYVVGPGDAEKNLAFDEADFVAFNTYAGVFGDNIAYHIGDMDALVRKPTEEYVGRVSEHFSNVPLVVTEFGTHGIKGLRGDARFTEDYQSAYLHATWQAISQASGIVGGVIWCWADYYHRRDFIGSGWGMLQSPYGPFGVVTVDRKAKQSLSEMVEMFDGEVESSYQGSP